jgi:hypothetical protein
VKTAIFYILFFSSFGVFAQEGVNNLPDTSLLPQSLLNTDSAKIAVTSNTNTLSNGEKKRLIAGVHVIGYASTIFLLGQTWYKDFPKTSFHVFNDGKEWLQVDKVGHGWTAYNLAKYSSSLWQWSGISHKKAVMLGGFSSLGYQTILEYFDAHSSEWGWSWADVAANILGAGLYVGEDLAWKEQRIQFKFSSHRINYDETLTPRADELYGKTIPERILKDYNGQTYWMSANLKSFAKKSRMPGWLNVAVGYGATGLFGGFENLATDKDENIIFDRRDIKRQRQWYLSPDIDFTKIKTNKKGVRTLLSVLNMVKLPAPTIELSQGKLKGHFLYF